MTKADSAVFMTSYNRHPLTNCCQFDGIKQVFRLSPAKFPSALNTEIFVHGGQNDTKNG
jgi:hypothetical protein